MNEVLSVDKDHSCSTCAWRNSIVHRCITCKDGIVDGVYIMSNWEDSMLVQTKSKDRDIIRQVVKNSFSGNFNKGRDMVISDEILDKELTKQIEHERAILVNRGESYSESQNRLINFYDGAALNKCTPAEYAYSLMSKHILALQKLTSKANIADKDLIRVKEYITDIRNYSFLIGLIFLTESSKEA